MTRSLVFIDSRVAGYQSLIAGLNADTGWVLLDSEHDGLAQMQAALVGYSGLESIQILSHGSAGALWLGTTFLDQSHIGDTLQPLHAIGQALAPTGDLLLYGCNVAAGEVGRSFIAALAEATGADVAASTDPTGAPALGGDWVLEQETGSIEASGLQGGDLSGLLAANTAPTFAIGDGMVTTDFGSFEYGNSVTVQADGKILVAGPSTLVRYNAGGSLDTSFDGDGKVTTGGASASVTVQADGKILVAGDSALERYNIDGSLDSSFDGDGKVTTGGASASVTVQADGKILVAGGSPDFSLARYNADGSLDTSFDGDGKVTTDFMGYDSARSVTVQADGKILVAGRGDYGGSYTSDFALARYNADGSLDTSFDIDGKVTTGIYNHSYKGESVTVQADGKILVAGDSSSSSRSPQFALARYNTDGSLDTSFSGDGLVSEISFGSYISSFAKKVTVQADGKILVAGRVTDDYYHTSSFALARFNANGSLDASFDNDGRVTTDFGSTNTYGSSATLQADGKILVAGTSNYDIALARYNADGSLDKTFSLAASTLSSSKTYSEQDNPIILDRDVQIFDTDLAGGDNYNGATLTLSRHGGANADDVFSAASGGSLSALQSGSVFSVNGVVIGLVTGNSAGTLTLAFTANATQSRVNSAIEQIAYANTSDTPPATVQIDWNFNDGNSGAQGTGGALGVIGSTTVHITSVNDVPTLATPLLDQDLAADLPFSYTLPAGAFVDLDLETLTYSASMADGSSMPLWLSFNTATHSFTGTPGAIDVGVAEIRVTATDVASASANDVFRLIVAVPINGASGDDSLSGGAGLDIMNGFAGNDTLNGGGGGDNLTGGTGKDTFRYTAATDSTLAAYDVITDFASDEQIAFSGMAGITAYSGSYTYTTSVADTVGAIQGDGGITNRHVFFTDGSHGYLYIKGAGSGVSFDGTLIKLTGITSAPGAAQLTHPIEGSSGNDTLIGGAGDDLLDSGAGSDYLNGGAGADTMLGGDGTDAYAVDHAGDLVSESNADLATGGNDIVYSTLAAYTLTDHVERLRLMFGGTSNGTGNTLDNMLYAGDGNNVLDGGAGNDTVSYAFATAGVAVSLATAGTQATGGSGSDTLISIENLIGGGFNDSLIGNAGNNVLDGGAGNDTVSYVSATAGVTLSLATAGAQATGGSGSDTLTSIENLLGSAYADRLTGNTGANSLAGGAGNDTLDGGAGSDTLAGGDGSDIYYVRDGGDVVSETNATTSTGGTDTAYSYLSAYTLTANVENARILSTTVANLTGNTLNNFLYAGAGNNGLNGGSGIDTVSYAYGQTGTSGVTVNLAVGTAQATGGSGSDTLTSIENLIGSAYADKFTGNTGANSLGGGAGNDTLDGGAGSDTMAGGDGSDGYFVRDGGDVVSETNADLATGGTDTVYSSWSAYTLTANVENGRILSTGAANLTGNTLNNFLYAGAGNNGLDGGSGTDTVSYAYGLAGTSGVSVSLAVSTAQATGGSGSDTLTSIENLFGSAYADQLTGNADANSLGGGAGNDTLDGGSGNDTMTGGDGSDGYFVRDAGDVVSETNAVLATGGTDTVYSYWSAYTLTANVENGRILSTGAANLTGNTLNNFLYAGAGNNVLNGVSGVDTASYQFATAAVSVSLATTAAQVTGGSGSDTLQNMDNLVGSSFHDTLVGDAHANTLNGLALNDYLDGAAGIDVLLGGEGTDLLIGGLGQDFLSGGAGSDTFDFNALNETGLTSTTWDVISDFVHGTDKIDLSTLDADAAFAGNQAFTAPVLGGTFSGVFASPGDLYFDTVAHVLYGNADSDAAAEFAIQLTGVTTLVAADFFC